MVRIDFFDYLNDVENNKKFENKPFSEIKKDIEELYEYNIVFEDLEKSRLFEASSIHIKNDDFIQTRLLLSEIKDKQKITGRLKQLSYNIELLKATVFSKDKDRKGNIIITEKIIKNDHSGIKSIITELDSLKSNLDKLENLHTNLMTSGLSLDVKTLVEQDFRKKHKKLNEIYTKQKNILLNLSKIFFKLTKDSLIKKR